MAELLYQGHGSYRIVSNEMVQEIQTIILKWKASMI